MPNASYALTRQLENTTFEEAIARTKAALADEGFGVLTEIDVAATFKKKLGIDRPPYLILGACNPKLAHRALEAEPSMGVLLPCNVDLFVDTDNKLWLQTVNPRTVFQVVANSAVGPIADEVGERLERVLDAVAR